VIDFGSLTVNENTPMEGSWSWLLSIMMLYVIICRDYVEFIFLEDAIFDQAYA
jgi:hypothetical protein